MTKALPRVRNIVACRVVADLQADRKDVPKLLREAGVKQSAVSHPDGWVRYESHAKLLELASIAFDDPLYGMNLSGRLSPRDFGVIAYVGMSSKDLGEALKNFQRYAHVHSEAWQIEIVETEQTAKISFTPTVAEFAQYKQAIECGMSLLLSAYHHFLGRRLLPIQIDFTHAPVNEQAETAAVHTFGCPVFFRRNRVQLTLPREALELPIMTADNRLLGILKEHCASLLRGSSLRPDNLIDRVRSIIVDKLSKGKCTAGLVGKELGLPERTLHRKLAELDTSFREVIDEIRLSLAQRYMDEQGLSTKQVAFLLGYGDPSAFGVAYRRWTGTTPKAKKRSTLV